MKGQDIGDEDIEDQPDLFTTRKPFGSA